MVEVRFWQKEDLPFLRWFAAVNAWKILPQDDRDRASIAAVVQSAEANLLGALNSPDGTALVAVKEGRPVGYLLIIILTDEKTGERSGYMADIYIEPEFRQLGIAGQFHKIGEQYLTSLGIRKATLWTHAHNSLGQKSAEKRGYKLRGMMMSKSLRA